MKISDFIELIKLPPSILAAISTVSSIILFIPDKYAKKIYMLNFRNNYGFIVSIVFLISLSVLLISFFIVIYNQISIKIKNKRIIKMKKQYLINADGTKFKILKNFIKSDNHTLKINQNDGLIQELSSYGIITFAGDTQAVEFGYNDEMYVYYYLQPWVINLIKEDEELTKKYL